jgi:hypothetical protein
MTIFSSWSDALTRAFTEIGSEVVRIGVYLLFSILLFVIGWLIAIYIEKFIKQVFAWAKVDTAVRQTGVEEVLKRGHLNLNSGAFVGGVVKWFIIAVFLVAAIATLGVEPLTFFLSQIIFIYVPRVLVAAILLVIAVMIANVVQRLIATAAGATGINAHHGIAALARWAIIIFAVLAALSQIGVGTDLIRTLFMGIVLMLAIAFGIAFGLGGKEVAGRIWDHVERDFTRKDR